MEKTVSNQTVFKPYELLFGNYFRQKSKTEKKGRRTKNSQRFKYFSFIIDLSMYLTTWFAAVTRPLYVNRSRFEFFNKIRTGLLIIGAGRLSPRELKAMGYVMLELIANLRKVFNALENDKPIVWLEWVGNSEMLGGFNVASINPELLAVFGMEKVPILCEAAENQGTPIEHCSAVKTSIGSYLLEQIPPPSLIIAGSHPCDTSIAGYQAMEYLTKAPVFTFDAPYWQDGSSYAYYEKQLWELIDFLEQHLNQKMDWDKLKETCEQANKVNYFLREISEMSRAIPSPSPITPLIMSWVGKEVDAKSPYLLKLAEESYKAAKKRYDAGKGIRQEEKLRAMFWFPEPIFANSIVSWIQEKYGAVTVVDFIGHITYVPIDTSSRETMIRDLAKEQLNLAMARQCIGPVELMTDEFEKCIDEYSVDCILFMGHNGCKHGWAAVKIFQDICKKRKVPALFLSLDIMDSRHTSIEDLEYQISEFFNSHGWG